MFAASFVVVVQSLSGVRLFAIPWTAARQASLSFTVSWSLLKLMPVESVMPSNHLSSSVTPFSSCPQPFPASGSFPVSRLCIRWPKSWSFRFSPSNEYSGLFPLVLMACISLQSKGLSRVFSNTTDRKCQFFMLSLLYGPTFTSVHDYWKTIAVSLQMRKLRHGDDKPPAHGHQASHIE